MGIEIDITSEKLNSGTFSTLKELIPAYQAAMKLVDSRQEDYGDSWVREGLQSAVGSAFRKASGIDFMFKDGIYKKKKEKFEEDLLDLMNYAALAYILLKIEYKNIGEK